MSFWEALLGATGEHFLGVGLGLLLIFGGYPLLTRKFKMKPLAAGFTVFAVFVLINLLFRTTLDVNITG